ncbi:DNA-directed DNA polymerase [Pseudozyma hubeiensis SY62]|uniref:DNA-directed DNA polymerase n=1 Tax=Pseudozyma hubeiensis (strain SY62) TaxID=1305764 RepID=R9NZZ6_PSEHS|nr:DNA-directed DNA polymerase [Pseudozyma hubeiensis SY62]GAC94498.1 DNA-directed DNA polymerase [Pseudozyma hubeiensis SY62]
MCTRKITRCGSVLYLLRRGFAEHGDELLATWFEAKYFPSSVHACLVPSSAVFTASQPLTPYCTFRLSTGSELRSSRPSIPNCIFIPISNNMTNFALIFLIVTAFATALNATPLGPSSFLEAAANDVDIARTTLSTGAHASSSFTVDSLSDALARLKPIRTPRPPIFENIQEEPSLRTFARQRMQEHRSAFDTFAVNNKRTRASESTTQAERGSRLRPSALFRVSYKPSSWDRVLAPRQPPPIHRAAVESRAMKIRILRLLSFAIISVVCMSSASIPLLEKVKQVVQEAAYAEDNAVPQLMASLHELQLRTGRQSSHVFETSSSSVRYKDRPSTDTDKRAAAALKWVKSRQKKPRRFPKTSKEPVLKPSKSI